MERELACHRCGEEMGYAGRENIQLGQTGLISGIWSNILAGSLGVDIYCCKACGRLEFFAAAPMESGTEELPQKTCPRCGRTHDFDFPKCPYCKYDYYE